MKQEAEGSKQEEDREHLRMAAEAHALQHSELFCALCTRQPTLLVQVMQAFAQVAAWLLAIIPLSFQ